MSIYPMGTFKQSPLLSTKSELGETVKPDVETLRNAKEALPEATGPYAPGIRWEDINLKYWRPGNGT